MPSTWEHVFMPLRKLHFWVLRNCRYNWTPPAWGLKSKKCCLRCLRTSHGLPWARSILSSILLSLEAEYSNFSKCSWLSSQTSWLGQMNHEKNNFLRSKTILKASTLGHRLYDTCSIATKFLPWGCLLNDQFGDIVTEDIQLSWDGKQDLQDVAQQEHCWEQALGIAINNVPKKTDRKTAQVMNWLFASRRSWGNKNVYLPKSCLRSSWALLKIGSSPLGLLLRPTELQPAMQAAWEKTYFLN